MMSIKLVFTSLLLLFYFTSFSQDKALQILPKKENKRTIIIKNEKRVRIKTILGKKRSGKVIIVNDSVIKIRKRYFNINEIVSIKKHPLALSLPVSLYAFWRGGIYTTLGGILLYDADEHVVLRFVAAILIPIGAAWIYLGFKPINFLKKYKLRERDKYKLKIIDL